MRPGKIYTLTNPVGNEIFYVGSTNVPLHKRLSVHVWCARNRPSGSVGKYLSGLTLKPFIEELESFESISDEELRTAELFWVRQLRGMGFPILNDSRPINDNRPGIVPLSDDELSYLKEKRKYVQIIRHNYNLNISCTTLSKVIKNGYCWRSVYTKIEFLISKLKELDYSRIVIRPHALMIILSESQILSLKRIMESGNKNATRTLGIHLTGLYRILKSGQMRYDKFIKQESILGQ